ncbi:DUF5723 family protein [Tenacibaculum finnmarkense]|uniref:DUF5723 family protein n=1 Tax=Tenacibaculum finnmarkense TaxID=2781243 RepID=UPI001EFB1AC5|nr:DUF5723 family protein [Tenacibaculum finnmarkense]MCG8776001.1 OmpA family protein [Tenacibaculum finnmarkense]
MKKIGLFGFLLCSSLLVKAQSYVGFHSDNYNGVHGVIFNPANIVDSRFKTDVNIVSASALLSNDYFGLNLNKIDSNTFDENTFDNDRNTLKTPTDNNNLFANVDVMGPSFMFNINKNNSIAVFTRARSVANISEINGTLFDELSNDFDDKKDFNINEGDFSGSAHAWAEVGVSYARVIFNNQEHFLKGGLSLKYLQGIGFYTAQGNDVHFDYDVDGTVLPGGQTTGSIDSDGALSYSRSSNLIDDSSDSNDFELVDGATSFGADFGFVYEWRPDHKDYKVSNKSGKSFDFKNKNKYKLKASLSVTDIGGISYKGSEKNSYNLLGLNINEDTFNSYDDLEGTLQNIYTETKTTEDVRISLPTALHMAVDYNINNLFYVNLNYDAGLRKVAENTNNIASSITLTPRFESKWFSFYSPIGINKHNNFSWGAGLRAGPLFVGSGSVLSNLISKESKSADVYVGLKIPIYQGKLKDKDKDGIFDKLDMCPKQAGPLENDGCPWKDTDGDTVLDKDDTCPEVAGMPENKGCPWKDTDGDTILDKDDTCPEVAGTPENNGCPDTDKDGISDDKDACKDLVGPLENNGCPWSDTDKDGVADKDDKCPTVAGLLEKQGCPEVVITKAAKAKLDEFARAIYFNSGKSTFKPGVASKLDLMAKIMQEYATAKFNIEGHTDSAGSAVTNQRFSDKRAKAVLDYLVKTAGIKADRLTSVGYGENNPISTNKTRAGRAENRRVEIKLVK